MITHPFNCYTPISQNIITTDRWRVYHWLCLDSGACQWSIIFFTAVFLMQCCLREQRSWAFTVDDMSYCRCWHLQIHCSFAIVGLFGHAEFFFHKEMDLSPSQYGMFNQMFLEHSTTFPVLCCLTPNFSEKCCWHKIQWTIYNFKCTEYQNKWGNYHILHYQWWTVHHPPFFINWFNRYIRTGVNASMGNTDNMTFL